jgi:protein-tyrosine phosphatase
MSILFPDAHHIFDNIYLGNINAANNEQWLNENGITHILGLVPSQNSFSNIIYLNYSDIDDTPSQNILKYCQTMFSFINETQQLSNKKILIHCYAGISRSSTIVIGYLMCKYNMSLENAYFLTKSKRNIINPNYGFYLQLQVLESLDFNARKFFIDSNYIEVY